MTFELLSDYNGQNKEVLLKHNKCNKEFKTIPFNFFRRKNKCPHCNNVAFIMNKSKKDMNENNLLDKKNKIIQSKLDKIYNHEYTYIKENEKNNYTIQVKHNVCDKIFTDYRKNLYNNKLNCPYCSKSNRTSNTFISINEKIAIYEKKLEYKFELLESFTTHKDKILVKKRECGHIIKKSMEQLFKGQDSCNECARLNRLNLLKQKLKEKHNDRYTCINGDNIYINNQTPLVFFDKRCNQTFSTSFTNILNNKNFDCPICNSFQKINNEIQNNIFNKFKGEYLMLNNYINSKTPIMFKHTKCNHIFFKTKNEFFSSKIPCKECSKKSRSLGMKNAQDKVNKKFGKLFTIKGIYINGFSKIPVICNSCTKVKEISLNSLMKRKRCPHCKKEYL